MMKKKALITGLTGQDGSYLAELLLEKGADPKIKNKSRHTALDLAKQYKHQEVVNLLEKHQNKLY